MENKNEVFPREDDPQKLAADFIIGKNRWLTRIRWVYTIFILLFFTANNYFSGTVAMRYRDILLVAALSSLGNIIFILALNRNVKLSAQAVNRKALTSLAAVQLDFDLVVLTLLVFFSGGFQSPMIVFFVFYIMVSTFLIYHRKAFKNTFTAMLLVLVIFFSGEGLEVTAGSLTAVSAFNAILLFTYFLTAYLSRNLRENEDKLQELLKKFRTESVTDGLTGLYNQTHFFLMLNLQMERARRYETPFSLIIFDVDNFKDYNDANGHVAGSAALKRVAELMRNVFRAGDILAKFGGDEFVIILPNSDHVGAFLGAERLRELVETEPFAGREKQPLGKVTLSLGIAAYPEHGFTTKELLDNADASLYIAKKEGRNRTVIFDTAARESSD